MITYIACLVLYNLNGIGLYIVICSRTYTCISTYTVGKERRARGRQRDREGEHYIKFMT